MSNHNDREIDNRELPAKSDADGNSTVIQNAEANNPAARDPRHVVPGNETSGQNPQTDGKKPERTPSPDPAKSGAGPAIAEHSKDAKAPNGGRQPGAYVKD